jgi:MFS transporter, DHA1 family, tetracycline resistance protein
MHTRNKSRLPIIVLTVFLDMLGISLVIPIAAPLFLSSDALLLGAHVSLEYRTLIMGLLLGIGPIVQFFITPLLGAYSDRMGRKPVLIVSVLVNALGHALFGLGIVTQQLWLLFASRVLAGVGSANLAAANSAVADVSDPSVKIRNFGLVGMGLGLGLIFGPFLGGVLSDAHIASWFTLATPLWFAAVLAILNAIVVQLFFDETLRERIHTPMSLLTGARNIAKAFRMPNLRSIYLVGFLMGFGYNFFAQFFSVFLVAKFQFSTAQIGALFAYIGIWSAFTQGVLTRYLAKFVPPRSIIRWAPLAAVAVLLFLAAVEHVRNVYLLLPLVAMAYGVNGPNITALISDSADQSSQGEVLGIDRAMAALSFGLPPILSGWAVALHVSMPMIVAAVFMFLAWLVFVYSYPRASRTVFHEVS